MLMQSAISEHWGEIEPLLRKHFAGEPERIRDDVDAGRAMLFVAEEGFMVVTDEVNANTGELELLVWFAYATGTGMTEKYQNEIREMCKAAGCVRVVMRTSVEGVARIMPALGWKKRYQEFTLEV